VTGNSETARVIHGPRPLGKSGLSVSPLAWGMWRYRGEDVGSARRLVDAALESGITLFDTADVYGPDNGEPFGAAESLLGRVFAEERSVRDRMVLATKGGIIPGVPYASGRSELVAACEASLRRLGVEQVDLYQVHRPDLLAHPAEVAAALDELKRSGKIAHAGVSNHTPAQTAALQAHLPFPLASVQPEFSPLAIDALFDGVLDQAMERGYAVLAWSPLAQGRLAEPGGDARAQAVVAELDRLAAAQGVGRTVMAYAWVLAHPSGAIPIVGSQRAERIREAVAALGVRIDKADWYAVLTAARGEPLP
jgi:aryl-alcohol dehydrogenase-like predicted oxidoreductase